LGVFDSKVVAVVPPLIRRVAGDIDVALAVRPYSQGFIDCLSRTMVEGAPDKLALRTVFEGGIISFTLGNVRRSGYVDIVQRIDEDGAGETPAGPTAGVVAGP